MSPLPLGHSEATTRSIRGYPPDMPVSQGGYVPWAAPRPYASQMSDRESHRVAGAQAGETVSFATTRRHYGIWHWRIERDSSQRFVALWSRIAASPLEEDAQLRLFNVAWALAGFERSYDLLAENFHRLEQARLEGVPPVMEFLSGPYETSLESLFGASLWIDLAEVVTHFRTVVDRFGHLKRPARRKQLPASVSAVEAELSCLQSLTLPALAAVPVTRLADNVLHEVWHPAGSSGGLSFPVYFRASGLADLAEDDLRGQLRDLVEATLSRVTTFVLAQAATDGSATPPAAAPER